MQDITAALGCPTKVYYKAEDKMKIHSVGARRSALARASDYFYNYITLGVVRIWFKTTIRKSREFLLNSIFLTFDEPWSMINPVFV